MTTDLLKQFRNLEAKATGGEWHSENGTIWVQVTDREGLPCQQELAGSSPADAALIVFLRNNAPRLFAMVEAAEGDLETERLRLAACGVAAQSNTPASIAEHGIDQGNPYWSASYGDVCDAVSREMRYRDALRQILGTLDDPTGGEHVADMRRASDIARAALAAFSKAKETK